MEINSSFYRPHQRATYALWAEGTPATFRFSVKLPRAITHAARLAGCDALLKAFVEQVQGLGPRLGCLFMQLAPSLAMAPSRWSPGTPARSGEEMLAMVTPWQLAVLKVVATPVKLGLLTRSPVHFGAHTFHTSRQKFIFDKILNESHLSFKILSVDGALAVAAMQNCPVGDSTVRAGR